MTAGVIVQNSQLPEIGQIVQKRPCMITLSRMKSSALGLLLLGLSAHANDASFVGDGATVYANKESRVRMVREEIRITFDEKGENQRRWRGDCQFEFENLT